MTTWARPRGVDDGFTLVELMMVVLIIAVLLAIAIPQYLGATHRANDRATKLNVRNAFIAERIVYNGNQTYSADPVTMGGVEPSLHWTNTLPDGSEPPNTVYIEVQDVPAAAQTVVVLGRSKTGKCFLLRDTMSGSGVGTYFNEPASSGVACAVPAAGDPSWSNAWTL